MPAYVIVQMVAGMAQAAEAVLARVVTQLQEPAGA